MLNSILKAYYNKVFVAKYPLQMMLYLNNNCNLKCSFCEIGLRNLGDEKAHSSIKQLSRDQIDKCIRLYLKRGIRRIYITGGEPFLATTFWYLLEKCFENKVVVEDITTNGTVLNSLSREKIDLINRVARDIIISIDSVDPKKHDENRGVQGTFDKIQQFLDNSHQRSLFKTNFSFNVVVHAKNFNELKDIIDLGVKWKITHINFQPVSTWSIFPDMERNSDKDVFVKEIDVEIYKRTLEEAYRYAKDKNINTNLKVFKEWTPYYFKYLGTSEFFFRKMPLKNTCAKVYNFIHINYNGDFIPCANLKPITNIDEKDCFEKWQLNGEKLKTSFKEGKYFDVCRNCFCDFPANYRLSLLYFPVSNFCLISKSWDYYIQRFRTK